MATTTIEWTRGDDGTGVPLFFKQAGAVLARQWGCTDPKGHKPEDWPEPFPRQFPTAVAA